MSSLVLTNAGLGIRANDNRAQPEFWRMDVHLNGDFRSPWWGRGSSGFIGDRGADVGVMEGLWFEPIEVTRGMNSRFGVQGVTRDVYGSVLGSCVVKMFRTSDDLKVDQTTSDALSGQYLVSTPYYPDAHYIVVYKTGSPDTFATSPNTLIAS